MLLLKIFLGLLPSFAWLFFYLKEDPRHDEAKKLLFATFALGAAAAFYVLPVQLFLRDVLPSFRFSSAGYGFLSFFIFGGFEEFFKFGVVYLFMRKQKNFTAEPIHVMIYMITAALGFAAAENVASVLHLRVEEGELYFSAITELITLRFIGATLLHSLSSGLLGYYWARGIIMGRSLVPFLGVGFVMATLLHAMFNTLIIITGPAGFAVIFLTFIAFFVLNDFEKLKRDGGPGNSAP